MLLPEGGNQMPSSWSERFDNDVPKAHVGEVSAQ